MSHGEPGMALVAPPRVPTRARFAYLFGRIHVRIREICKKFGRNFVCHSTPILTDFDLFFKIFFLLSITDFD